MLTVCIRRKEVIHCLSVVEVLTLLHSFLTVLDNTLYFYNEYLHGIYYETNMMCQL